MWTPNDMEKEGGMGTQERIVKSNGRWEFEDSRLVPLYLQSARLDS